MTSTASVFSNVFSQEDIHYLIQLPEVVASKTKINLQNAGVKTPAFVPDFPYGKSGGGIPLKNAVRPTRGTDRVLEVKNLHRM